MPWIARCLFGILLPFSGWALIRNAFVCPLLITYFIVLFTLMTISRYICDLHGLVLILGQLLAAYFASILIAIWFLRKRTLPLTQYGLAMLFSTAICISLATVYHQREAWLGVNLFYVPSTSMSPTLLPGDIILADTWHYRERSLSIGDTVVFTLPDSPTMLVKRIYSVSDNNFSAIGDYQSSDESPVRLRDIQHEAIRGKATAVIWNVSKQDYPNRRAHRID